MTQSPRFLSSPRVTRVTPSGSASAPPAPPAPRTVRSAEMRRVVELLTAGTSVELVGVRWSGRSEVLRYVREELRTSGIDVLTVSGTGGSLPLEAVRVALPPAYRDAIKQDSPASAVGSALTEYLSEGPSVVIVDDSDLLDEQSWELLVSAYKRLGFPVVSSRLLRAHVDPDEHLLIKFAHPVAQVSLEDLRLEDLHAILEDRVDGMLSPAVSARIHTKSAGIPGLATALLDGAVAQGLVRRVGDHWTSGSVLWSDEARGAYESMLYSFRPEVRDAVELLGVAGTMDLEAAWALLGHELVEELEGHQLLRVTAVGPDDRPVLGVHPPGIGDYFLNQPISARRRRIVDAAVSRVAQADARISSEARDRLLARLGTGVPVVPGTAPSTGWLQSTDVPAVTRMITEAYKVELAAARGEWEVSRDRRSAARYLQLQLTGANDPEEFERVLAGVAPEDPSDPDADVFLRYAHSRWLLTQGATVEAVVRALTDGVPEGFVHAEALDTLARAVEYERNAIDPGYEEVLAPRAAGADLGAQVAGLVLSWCHLLSGRVDDALHVVDEIEGDLLPVGRLAAGMLRGFALYATGQFTETLELATEQARQAIATLDRPAFAAYTYLGALARVASGHLDEAQDALAVVLSSGIVARPMAFPPDRAILVVMAVVAARTGHEVSARSFIEHANQILGTSDALPFGSNGWAEAIAVAGSGETEVAAGIFADLVADARRRGYVLAADIATMTSLFIHFDPELAGRFRDRAEALGGPLYLAYLDARDAAHDRDARRVEAAARSLQVNGAESEALTFYSLAGRLYRESGDVDSSTRVRVAARTVAEELGLAPHLMDALDEPDFTSREREVIRLVAAGRSNNDIAAEMFISVRTVESHLRNIRRRSGAVDRREIAGFA